jgi:autotransporter-associated beta strand protein
MDSFMRLLFFAYIVVSLIVESSQAQTFNVGANFQTVSRATESPYVPPDTSGAAGQNHIVILDNGRYKSFTKIGGQTQTFTDTTFFSNAGYSGSGGLQNIAGDPRVRFDPFTGRWYAMMFTNGDASGVNNRLVIAVSADANPTSQWKAASIQTSINKFADFPTLGVDKNGLYIGTNNFGGSTNVSLFTMSKTGLLWSGANTPTITDFTPFEGLNPSTHGFTLQPANNFDVNQTGNIARVVDLYGTAGSPVTNNVWMKFNINNTGGTTNLGGNIQTLGALQDQASSAQQLGGNNVQTGGRNISGQVVQMGNFLYFANTFDNGTGRAQVRVTVMNASTGALVQEFNFNDPTLAYFYPTVAVNESGQAVVGFSGSSSSQFIGAYAAVGAINQATGAITWGTASQVSAGTGTYVGFGAPGDPAPYRWGDYSAVAVDPADTGIFWSFQERAAAGTANWQTLATEIIPTVAGQVRWQTAGDGDYSDSTKWFNGLVPGATDHVIYSRNGTPYTVTMPVGTTSNNRISVRQGNTTLNIAPGSTYQATNLSSATPSFAVSQMLGDSTVTITGGGTLSTVYTTLAAGENGLTTDNISKATVNINGATWNNSQDVYFGGNATRSGGQAQLNISNSGTVSVGQVARFWTSTSGVSLNGATPVNFNVGGLRADVGVNPLITGSGATANLNITNGLGQNYFGQISGTVNVTKSGVGTQTLSGSNMTYTGITTINGGRLNINGVKLGTGTVSVNNTGVLGGTGSVAGLVLVAAGGKISPGLSPGNLTLTSGINMSAGTYEWELAALTDVGEGTNYDKLTLDGGASVFGGTSQVELDFLGGVDPNAANPFWNSTHQWRIVDLLSGTLTGNFSGIANANFSTGSFFLSGGSGADIFLNFSPVPEPSSIALVGGSLVGLLIWCRRRSRSSIGNQ